MTPPLYHFRCALAETSLGAAFGRILVVVGSMTSHLANRAGITPEAAAAIFATFAVLLWNVILTTHVRPGAARDDEAENYNAKENTLDKSSKHLDPYRCRIIDVDTAGVRFPVVVAVGLCEDSAEHLENEAHHEHNHDHSEKDLVGRTLDFTPTDGISTVVELQAGQYLSQKTQGASETEAAINCAAACSGAATAQSITPVSKGNVMTSTAEMLDDDGKETLACANATFRLYQTGTIREQQS